MIGTTSFGRTLALLGALGIVACGGNVEKQGNGGGGGATGTSTTTSTTTTVPGPYDACTTATDCGWTEIDHEIVTAADCPCLYGCPYIPLAKESVDRRAAQYQALCTPGVDGHGTACGIDDCALPGMLACQTGHCTAAAPGQ